MTAVQSQVTTMLSQTPESWVPNPAAISGAILPFVNRTGAAYQDVLGGKAEWAGFYGAIPNMSFPTGATVTGLSIDIYGHKETNTGQIDDGSGAQNTELSGLMFMTNDGSPDFASKISGGPTAHIDSLPVSSGIVTSSNKVTIGTSSTLWGFTQAELKAQLIDNSTNALTFVADPGTYNGNANSTSLSYAPSSGAKIGGLGTWTISGVPGDPIAHILALDINQAGGWTPAVQTVTSASPNFRGLTFALNFTPPPGFRCGTFQVKVYGQNQGLGTGNAVGKLNVDGLTSGSKTVASSGMIYVAKGSTAFSNRKSGGDTAASHLDLFSTDSGTISTGNVLTLGDGFIHWGETEDAIHTALTTPTPGVDQFYLVIDNAIFYSPTPGTDIRTVEIGPIVLIVSGYQDEDRSRRTIAAVVFNAHYTLPGGAGGGAASYAMLLIPEEDFNDSMLKDFVTEISKRP